MKRYFTCIIFTILWGNSAASGSEIYVDSGSNIEVCYSDVQGAGIWPGECNINDDPLLVADSLADASPCIGAGIDVYNFSGGSWVSPPKELRGDFRVGYYPDGVRHNYIGFRVVREII
ncbi:MAG: hypothetical protein ACT6FE_05905 [Methanosarcinaceae archaeon]